MNRKINFIIVSILSINSILLVSGCGNSDSNSTTEDIVECTGSSTTAYEFNLPAHIPQFVVPPNNPTTVEGVALGKRLYYDEMLSLGGPFEGNACASCHLQSKSFSNNSSGTSVLLHTNLNWSTYYLWDGAKSGSLEDVMNFEIADFFQANIELFKADKTYQEMNCEAFGRTEISQTDMANAMAQWMRTLISVESKYDRYLDGEVELTEQELRGEFLFTVEGIDCVKCHSLPLTTDNVFHNNGLNSFHENNDLGRFNVTNDSEDIGKFKTPTLRNIALTAPYMHDGRLNTLEEVVEFYNSGVTMSLTIEPFLADKFVDDLYDLGISEEDKAALVAFLNTFTDTSFINNPDLSDPFK